MESSRAKGSSYGRTASSIREDTKKGSRKGLGRFIWQTALYLMRDHGKIISLMAGVEHIFKDSPRTK
jgi:hypothetical protein